METKVRADRLTPVEQEFCLFIMGRTGGFMTALFTAIAKADSGNLERLRLGFPDEVAAHERWTRGDLAKFYNKACKNPGSAGREKERLAEMRQKPPTAEQQAGLDRVAAEVRERQVLRSCAEKVWLLECRACGKSSRALTADALDDFVAEQHMVGWRASIERGALCPDCAEKAGLRK